jgi:hypothetical protein
MYLLTICVTSLGPLPTFNWVFAILILSGKSSLPIVDMSPLSHFLDDVICHFHTGRTGFNC